MSSIVRDLVGSVALVTGATSGIGRAAATHLAARGAKVLIAGRNADRGEQVLNDVEHAGNDGRFIAADLAAPDGIRALAAEAGPVDILVNNAGTAWYGPTADLDIDTYDRLFAANVRSTYLLTAALAPGMMERHRGAIVNVSSTAATLGLAGAAAYSATKAALEALTRSWAAEFSPHGVRVNTVAPGPVHTNDAGRARKNALGAATLFGRAAEPDEIATVIGFLVSPAASYITGAIVPVDAGRAIL